MTMNHKQQAEWHLHEAGRHPLGSEASTEHIGLALTRSVLALVERLDDRGAARLVKSAVRQDIGEVTACRP